MDTYTDAKINAWSLLKSSILQELEELSAEKPSQDAKKTEAFENLQQAKAIAHLWQARLDCILLPVKIEQVGVGLESDAHRLRELEAEFAPSRLEMRERQAEIDRYAQRIESLNTLKRRADALSQTIRTYEVKASQEDQRIASIGAEISSLSVSQVVNSYPYHPHYYHHHHHSPYCHSSPAIDAFQWVGNVTRASQIADLDRERQNLLASSTKFLLAQYRDESRQIQSQIAAEAPRRTLEDELNSKKRAIQPFRDREAALAAQSSRYQQAQQEHCRLTEKLQAAQKEVADCREPTCPMEQAALELALAEAKGLEFAAQRIYESANSVVGRHHDRELTLTAQMVHVDNERFLRSFVETPGVLYQQLLKKINESLDEYEKQHAFQQSINARQCLFNLKAKLAIVQTWVRDDDVCSTIQLRLKLMYGFMWAAIDALNGSAEIVLRDKLVASFDGFAFDKTEAIAGYTTNRHFFPEDLSQDAIVRKEQAEYQTAYQYFELALSGGAPEGQADFYAQGRRLLAMIRKQNLTARAEPFDYKYYAKVLSCARHYLLTPSSPECLDDFKTILSANTKDTLHKDKVVIACALLFLGVGLVAAGLAMVLSAFIAPPLLVAGVALLIGGSVLVAQHREKGTVKQGHDLIKLAGENGFFSTVPRAVVVPPVSHVPSL